ncbi:HlyD family secretion protein [Vitiosangium sp. GDMCC 1.1324]|uniref:HlyD family secretion protein n=1 Tax=Vitiosangium sp. (strain GDMCC 1.1324) TaxID=2138576 RepID=UPI000D3B93C3|nr:HlyD family secretion protein [Vitiosangium sp. GDMCC 1.1324]PTL74994.1 HlyD family secretion protein [Vitiosangium sp. GDMCC 1.1324]
MSATPRLVEKDAPAPAPEELQRKSRGRRGAIVLGTVMVAVLAGIGGYVLLTRGQEVTDNAQVQADMVPINARVGGPVLRVHVEDNARVKKGDVLVEVDPREYSVRVKQAEAEWVSARAQAQAADAQVAVAEASARGGRSTARAVVSTSTAAVSSAEAQVEVARAAVARAETEAQRSTLELERVEQLRKSEVASQQELDDARAAHEAAQASLAGARAQLSAVEQSRQVALSKVAEAQGQFDQNAPVDAKIAVARASAELAHARVTAAEAALEQARLQLEYTRVIAPADGQVSKLTIREGQLLSAGQPVARLVPPRTYVIANFKETQVGHIRPGQRVEVKVDAFPGRTLTGLVESLSGGTGASFSLLPPDNASGNFVKVVQRVPVRISWKDTPEELPLQAGLSAEVTVFTASH